MTDEPHPKPTFALIAGEARARPPRASFALPSLSPPPPVVRRRSPRSGRRTLSAEQRDKVKAEMAANLALVDALEMLESAYATVSPSAAFGSAQACAGQLGGDVGHLQLVVACLAVEAVWMVPPASTPEVPRTDVEIAARQLQLSRWAWGRRRAVMMRLRSGRARLRGTR